MLQVDTDALVAAARSLEKTAVALLTAGSAVHPPLAGDEASVTAATRFTHRAMGLSGDIRNGARGLLSSAATIRAIAGNYEETDEEIARAHAVLQVPRAGAGQVPHVEPIPSRENRSQVPMPPPLPRPGELVAATFYSGDASRSAGFIAQMQASADHAQTASAATRSAAQVLDSAWRSPVSAAPAIEHLSNQSRFFGLVASEHRETAAAASQHAQNFEGHKSQADSPQDFERLRAQIAQVEAANNTPPNVGRYNGLLKSLNDQLTEMEQRNQKNGADYHGAADDQSQADPPSDEAKDMGQAAGLAAALPGMLASLAAGIVGAVGGLAAKVPEAAGQAATQAVSGIGSAMGANKGSGRVKMPSLDPSGISGVGGGEGAGGGTSPAGGLAPAPGVQTPPAGGLDTSRATSGPLPAAAPAAPGGGGGMGMAPMGGMGGMGGGGAAGEKDKGGKEHKVLVRAPRNSEPVKGVLQPTAQDRERSTAQEPEAENAAVEGTRRIVLGSRKAKPADQ
ncbi:PPE protein [Mycobacteroides abscessus subsp. abscessus]|uniref:PE domain-containing protein n=1 Tax=Mycobacteroides abscessus TaxID=36809 RepID=UPI000925C3F6|nr:PE domain-containing protein [Mycobacteroides abscessus]SIB95693.1 PPE protein [Mycobacteroides abscessus subsp. abscessus]